MMMMNFILLYPFKGRKKRFSQLVTRDEERKMTSKLILNESGHCDESLSWFIIVICRREKSK